VRAAPISSALARGLGGILSPDSARVVGEAAYWSHVVIVLSFLNYLPYSKHIHLLGALPNILTMNLSDRKLDIPKANLEDESQWGVGKYEQFSWKQLLDTYACTECARRSSYCPANATQQPASPMQVIHDIRYEMLDTGTLELEVHKLQELHDSADALERPELRTRLDAAKAKIEALPPMVGGRILEETLWSCTMCGACQEACP